MERIHATMTAQQKKLLERLRIKMEARCGERLSISRVIIDAIAEKAERSGVK